MPRPPYNFVLSTADANHNTIATTTQCTRLIEVPNASRSLPHVYDDMSKAEDEETTLGLDHRRRRSPCGLNQHGGELGKLCKQLEVLASYKNLGLPDGKSSGSEYHYCHHLSDIVSSP